MYNSKDYNDAQCIIIAPASLSINGSQDDMSTEEISSKTSTKHNNHPDTKKEQHQISDNNGAKKTGSRYGKYKALSIVNIHLHNGNSSNHDRNISEDKMMKKIKPDIKKKQ